uniref:Uncharacterized protein n=1 Tax=Arundo donax TaxID=35708 RepID=A0A0A8YU86_ARUDO
MTRARCRWPHSRRR